MLKSCDRPTAEEFLQNLLVEEPQNYRLYRGEAVDAITAALESSLFDDETSRCLFITVSLHRGVSASGVSLHQGGHCIVVSDDTGSTLGVVTLMQQIRQFEAIKDNLTAIGGIEIIESFLSKSLFIISTGSNDIFGYFETNSTEHPEDFTSLLVNAYESYIRTLYSIGARKFGITSIAPVGCCPVQRLLTQTGGCFDPANELAQIFYPKLSKLLNSLSSELYGMKYSLGNAYQLTLDTIQNPLPLNLTNVDAACCGYGKLNAEKLCDPTANLCGNRENYLFWDSFHPSQAASLAAAEILYNGPTKYASPINLAQLAKDDI